MFAAVPVGRRVLVIGGGMTAIDVATQARLLGAQEVTIAYRRAQKHERLKVEQNQSSSKGVTIRHWMKPAVTKTDGGSLEVKLEFTALSGGKLAGTGKFQTIEVDQLFTAMGQTLASGDAIGSITVENGRIAVDDDFRDLKSVGLGRGDCVAAGEDLTVAAVAQGRDAANRSMRR